MFGCDGAGGGGVGEVVYGDVSYFPILVVFSMEMEMEGLGLAGISILMMYRSHMVLIVLIDGEKYAVCI